MLTKTFEPKEDIHRSNAGMRKLSYVFDIEKKNKKVNRYRNKTI
jgi:hypothetical protein